MHHGYKHIRPHLPGAPLRPQKVITASYQNTPDSFRSRAYFLHKKIIGWDKKWVNPLKPYTTFVTKQIITRMKTRRIHLRLRVPSRLRSDYRPSLQGIDTCRQQSALREGMMIARSRWSTPTGSLSQNRSGNDARKQMESPENSLSFRLDLKDCLNWFINQCAQTTNTKLPSRRVSGIRIHSPYAPRAPDSHTNPYGSQLYSCGSLRQEHCRITVFHHTS